MLAFFGLGNPGEEYADTPHNAGYLCIDGLCRIMEMRLKRLGNALLGAKGEWQGRPLLLAKPTTYMNDSGRAVRWAVDYFSLPHSDLFLVYDDVDLPMGSIRIREKGSAGTHRGMKSVIQWLGSQEFPRIRVGIQPQGKKVANMVRYVLSPVRKKDRDTFQQGIEHAVSAVQAIVAEGLKGAMNRYNRRNDSLLLQKRLI